MKIKTLPRKKPEENIIPLINVVFLMLVFFLIAGTLRSFPTKDLKPANVREQEKQFSKTVHMHILATGEAVIEGQTVVKTDLAQYLARNISGDYADKPFYILADQNLEARLLLEFLDILSKAGIRQTHLIAMRKGRE